MKTINGKLLDLQLWLYKNEQVKGVGGILHGLMNFSHVIETRDSIHDFIHFQCEKD